MCLSVCVCARALVVAILFANFFARSGSVGNGDGDANASRWDLFSTDTHTHAHTCPLARRDALTDYALICVCVLSNAKTRPKKIRNKREFANGKECSRADARSMLSRVCVSSCVSVRGDMLLKSTNIAGLATCCGYCYCCCCDDCDDWRIPLSESDNATFLFFFFLSATKANDVFTLLLSLCA